MTKMNMVDLSEEKLINKKYNIVLSTDPNIMEKQKEYIKYVNEHINNVQKAWNEVKMKCITYMVYVMGPNHINFEYIDFNIKNHDISKFSKEEFEPYRKNFYPVDDKEKEENKEAFDKAWIHHYMNNPHHWDYFASVGREDEMTFKDVVEMICDWQAMGYKFGNTAKEWYEKNKSKIKLGKQQKIWVDEMLNLLDK